jgi:hypothetical protein
MAGPLGTYVNAFVDGVAAELRALSGKEHRNDCVIEAESIVSAVLASDGRFAVSELDAWLDDIGPALDPPVFISTQQLRDSDLFQGKELWITRPSTMFDLLIQADRRDNGRRATAYYELAMKLAHATAAIDLMPSPDEIAAIDTFRSTLLGAFDANATPRPGQPAAAAGAGGQSSLLAPAPELPPERPIEQLLAELDTLIGLEHVKVEVRRLTSLLRIQKLRAEHDLPTVEVSRHLVFTGNPGTGKTTVARILSQIYRSLDVVTKGHLVETDRSDLVAGYVGQTAARTRAILESALGGTLIIDEAYALARGGENDFGREAIDTLVKFMEDHRDDLAIVACGYPAEMAELIDANPGLASRFTRTLIFPDYTSDELVAIFELTSSRQQYHLDADARKLLRAMLEAEPRGRGFGNARLTRNLFESAIARQALRLADVDAPTIQQLTTLVAADLADATA